MIRSRAFAKVNLSLRVDSARADGLHPVHGLVQSIDWWDTLRLDTAEEDEASGPGGDPVIDEFANLGWRAVVAVREAATVRPPLRLEINKELPVAAGLGGGSADAAAALAMAGRLLGVDRSELEAAAPRLGADVPFCLVGGTALVTGSGERVRSLPDLGGFALAIAVPPVEMSTAAVYAEWDRRNGPQGPAIPHRAAPPALRDDPLVNDLYPAATAVEPVIDDWRAELENAWDRPVAMSGSGPSLFAFFVDHDEALSAVAATPSAARAARAVSPVRYGWLLRQGESAAVDSRGATVADEAW